MQGISRSPAPKVRRPTGRGTSRDAWIDNLRIAVIAGVVVVHAATAYVVDIDWYYEERTTSMWTALPSSVLAGLAGLFGLGPVFLLAGVLAASSLRHRGPARFATTRLLRLGLPLVTFVLVLDPVADYAGSAAYPDNPSLAAYLANRTGERDTGPLWFVVLLLLGSQGYAGWRCLRPTQPAPPTPLPARVPYVTAAAIAVASFVVWLRWPLDSDVFLNARWPEWPQGAAIFALGLLAGERGWLERVPRSRRRGWGLTAVFAAAIFVALTTSVALGGDLDAMAGGLHWQAAALAVIDGALAVSVSLWTVAWFRQR